MSRSELKSWLPLTSRYLPILGAMGGDTLQGVEKCGGRGLRYLHGGEGL